MEQKFKSKTEKHYNLKALEKLAMGNTEFTNRMVAMFLSQMPELQEKLQTAASSFDLDSVARIAHKMKSGIDTLGIADVSEEVHHLERALFLQWTEQELSMMVNRLVGNLNVAIQELRTDFRMH